MKMKSFYKPNRREFIKLAGASVGLLASPYSLFNNADKIAIPGLQVGCALITWGDGYVEALPDVAKQGYAGVQIRGNAYAQYRDKPEALLGLLQAQKLEAPILSSGSISLKKDARQKQIDEHATHARWLKKLGGRYVQVVCNDRKGGQAAPQTAEDLTLCGILLTEVGKACADEGIRLLHHNHMDSLGQNPNEVRAIHAAADPVFVGLLLDVAHYAQAGGDPASAIREHKDIIFALHLKDVRNTETAQGYQFMPLGQGRVDLPACFKAMADVRYKGWAMVELDAVPEAGLTAAACSETSMRYIRDRVALQ